MANANQNKTELNAGPVYIFSLGNPGVEYKYTRHNAGRIVCDELISEKYFEEMPISGQGAIKYYEPDTYMNETGKCIADKMRHARDDSVVVIVYDDIDLVLGEVKLSYGRSSGGHNGVESVIQSLGTRDFYRLRIGIGGKPIKEMLLQDYVLSKLREDEVKILRSLTSRVKEKIEEIRNK